MPPPPCTPPRQPATCSRSTKAATTRMQASVESFSSILLAIRSIVQSILNSGWRAGTTATLTSDPFQPGPTASASFSASVRLPGYFPVLPATSSAVLVNNGDPDDPGKCPCLVMTLRGSQLLRPRLQVHAGACAHRLRPAVACSAACPCSRTTALGQTTQRRPVC